MAVVEVELMLGRVGVGSAEVLTTVVLGGAPATEVVAPPPPPAPMRGLPLLSMAAPDWGGVGVGFGLGLMLVAGDCCWERGWARGLTL